MKTRYLLILFALGLGLALVWVLGDGRAPAVAAPVLSADVPSVAEGPCVEGHIKALNAPADELHACLDGCLYASIQDAEDAASDGVLWHDTPVTVSESATALVTMQNQHTGDPSFVDPYNADRSGRSNYHISPGSAAIDAGVDAGVDHDIDGDPRPLGSGYDLGADEAGLVVTKQATPDPVQPGKPLTYTIRITNTTDEDLHATITDTLPLSVTLDWASGGTLAPPNGTVVLPDGRVAVTWTAVITAPGGVWMGTILVTVD